MGSVREVPPHMLLRDNEKGSSRCHSVHSALDLDAFDKSCKTHGMRHGYLDDETYTDPVRRQ